MYRCSGLDIDFYRWSKKFIYLKRRRCRPTTCWNVKIHIYCFTSLMFMPSLQITEHVWKEIPYFIQTQHSPHSHLCCSVPWPFYFFFWYFQSFFIPCPRLSLLHYIKPCAANFIDSSATSHQHFRGTEMTSIQLLQWYLNSSASFAFIGKIKKKVRL